jgi:outer membrane receptor protein involved in Fe transport
MNNRRRWLWSNVSLVALLATGIGTADRAEATEAAPHDEAGLSSVVGELIVTAQKRSQSINSVPMSITAATGDQLVKQGIVDSSELSKIVPAFTFTQTGYGTPVYTLRGVGYQDNTLSASPAVSTYLDEVPVPFPAETLGLATDVERVEVLKGPQGILYGENSTGGAINYIAAKPTSTPQAGFDASYGRFNAIDAQGFVSGPLSDTLRARVSARMIRSDDWQYSYTRPDTNGAVNKLMGRILLDWTPTDKLSIAIDLNGWRDRSDTQAAQDTGFFAIGGVSRPALANYPLAPANDRAADWDAGEKLRNNNSFYQGSIKGILALTDDINLTSITAYEEFKRDTLQDVDGTNIADLNTTERANSHTAFQELRLSGDTGRLNWLFGGNYQYDHTYEFYGLNASGSTGTVSFGLPINGNNNENTQNVETWAVYGNGEFKLTDTLTAQGGLRYTSSKRSFAGCSRDQGDGLAAKLFAFIDVNNFGAPPGTTIPPGGCFTYIPANNAPGLYVTDLNEDNVSWRGGLNWSPEKGKLFYASISKGYKSGAFPTLSASSAGGFHAATQESVLAYEAGVKLSLFDTLQLNGAGFYYEYDNKQFRGRLPTITGIVGTLVNVPKSHIDGFELSATWQPVPGLTITPGVTLTQSQIDGNFTNYDGLGHLRDFDGEALPYTPKWSGNVDAEYNWPINGMWDGFVGGNFSFQSQSNATFGALAVFNIKENQLLDLRAGAQTNDGRWRLTVFGQNVTNQYYWTSANKYQDTLIRMAGMPVTYGVRLSYRYR